MPNKNFVDNSNMTSLMQGIANKINSLGGYVFRGSVTFANLPSTLTTSMTGYVYNVSDDFTTDSRFIEGSGKKYPAGTNVAVANVGVPTYTEVEPVGDENPKALGWYEETTPDSGEYVKTTDTEVDSEKTYYTRNANDSMKFDVLGNFVDVDAIYDVVAGQFDVSESYATGDVVVYEGALYQFTSDHAAGEWDPSDVQETDVATLITQAAYHDPESLTAAQVEALLALLD